MTAEEAIKEVIICMPDTEAREAVIEALEKQIPKKPINITDHYLAELMTMIIQMQYVLVVKQGLVLMNIIDHLIVASVVQSLIGVRENENIS